MHKLKTRDYLSPATSVKPVEMEQLICSSISSSQSTTDNFIFDDEDDLEFLF